MKDEWNKFQSFSKDISFPHFFIYSYSFSLCFLFLFLYLRGKSRRISARKKWVIVFCFFSRSFFDLKSPEKFELEKYVLTRFPHQTDDEIISGWAYVIYLPWSLAFNDLQMENSNEESTIHYSWFIRILLFCIDKQCAVLLWFSFGQTLELRRRLLFWPKCYACNWRCDIKIYQFHSMNQNLLEMLCETWYHENAAEIGTTIYYRKREREEMPKRIFCGEGLEYQWRVTK